MTFEQELLSEYMSKPPRTCLTCDFHNVVPSGLFCELQEVVYAGHDEWQFTHRACDNGLFERKLIEVI